LLSGTETINKVASLYEWLAWLIGTQPINVDLASDAFTFSRRDTRVNVRPVVWVEDFGQSSKIVAVGDEAPPAGAVRVDISSPLAVTLSSELRQRALEAVLIVGLKSLAHTGTFQRPEIIFHNDILLARGFDDEQRRALTQACVRARAFGTRFG
jgi:hypothetical protein